MDKKSQKIIEDEFIGLIKKEMPSFWRQEHDDQKIGDDVKLARSHMRLYFSVIIRRPIKEPQNKQIINKG